MRRLSLLALAVLVHAALTVGALWLSVTGAARQLFQSAPETAWDQVAEAASIVLASPLMTVASQLGADLTGPAAYPLLLLNSMLWVAALATLAKWRPAPRSSRRLRTG